MLGFILLIIVSLANGILATILFLNNPKAMLNRVFSLLVLVLAAWSITVFLEDWSGARSIIDILAKLDYLLATIVLGLFYCFCRLLSKHRQNLLDATVIILTILVSVATILGLTVEATFDGAHTVLKPAIGYGLFLALLVVDLTGGFWLLFSKFRSSHGRTRAQLRMVGLGIMLTVIFLVLAEIVAPVVFGITGPEVTRIGVYAIVFFTGFTTYAIIKHRFMDVRLLVARSLAYLMLLLTLATGYSLAALQLGGILFGDATNTLAHQIYNIILALILAFTFQPLRRFFERITSRLFYRDSYDSQQVINDFSKILVSEIELEAMLKHSLTQLCRSMYIQFGQVVVFDHDKVYRIDHYGPLPRRLMIASELRQLNKPLLVADELESGERKTLMEEHGIRVSVDLSARGEQIGYLLLGDKLSGDIYSSQDIELLEILKKELAVAVLNAKAYAEIREFNQTLQQRVDYATNRLRVANRHLKELDKTKDEFISMASHQLRTPLTTIKGYLSMMLEGDAGRLTTSQKEFVGYAFGSSERMVNLISDLLNVSRLSAGRFLIQAKPTDMVQMVADEVRQLHNHATAKNVQLLFEHPTASFPVVELDDNKTRQVIMNFIDNAIYYTQKGSVTVRLEHDGNMVRLEVRDTGIGVPDKAKKKLFSKFYRAENAQVVRPDGTGLGLYLAKRVIEDQGGTIIFKSTEGRGSVFGFELPVKAKKPKVKASVAHG